MATVLRPSRLPTWPLPAGSGRRVLGGLLAAFWAAGAGLAAVAAVVLVLWAADPASNGPAFPAARLAAVGWLLAMHGSVSVPGGTVAIVPITVTAGTVLLLHRAGRAVGRTTAPETVTAAATSLAAMVVGYAAVAGALAALTQTVTVRVSVPQAVAGAVVLAALAGGAGLVAGAGWWDRSGPFAGRLRWLGRWPDVVAAGSLTALALVSAGGMLAGLAVLGHLHRVAAVAGGGAASVAGEAGLLALQLAYLPDAALWGVGYLAGPGFAAGTGTVVSPFAAHLGPLPGLPLLAGLPAGGHPWPALAAVLAVPVLIGAGCGVVLGRRTGDAGGRWTAAGLAAAAVGVAALEIGMLCWLAAGPAGPGRLAVSGPVAWAVGLAVAGLLVLPAVLVAAWRVPTERRRWRFGRSTG